MQTHHTPATTSTLFNRDDFRRGAVPGLVAGLWRIGPPALIGLAAQSGTLVE
jgi:hypothetical protein